MMRLATAPMTSFPVSPAWAPASRTASLPAHKTHGWKPLPLPLNPALGQMSPGTAKAAALGVMLLPTLSAAAVSYVGFRLGTKDQGIPSILGYVVGAFAGITAVIGVLAMLGIATIPSPIPPVTTEVQAPSGSI